MKHIELLGINLNDFYNIFSHQLIEFREKGVSKNKYKLYSNNAQFLLKSLTKKGIVVMLRI
jgi:hypothetical protein